MNPIPLDTAGVSKVLQLLHTGGFALLSPLALSVPASLIMAAIQAWVAHL